MRAVLLLAAAALSLAGCAGKERLATVGDVAAAEQATGWRALIAHDDSERLQNLDGIWQEARAVAMRRSKSALAGEADLLAADAALDHPALPPGSYNCRLVSIGQKTRRGPAVRAYRPFFCYVRSEGADALSFTKQTGTDLPGGWLHPDGDRRYVFLGAKQLKPGDNSLGYGSDSDRDLAGVVERVAPFRWRLVVPWRNGKPGLDVYELTPVPAEQQAPQATETTATDTTPGG
ncbi:DUF4893 domain-containing protein [Sphingomonas gilva]|uniref:DUF4893 domain-containing protein n=1 Tax=Sphingomonas gilva TaxID=2305907 RepID=A0A396RP50_9SPHN|nr:DUF4893 domain-containing protein [Sphingomonas gilva]RHW18307.1 DUF4893 domain-containing protein [Sphingomonas gilva]